MNLFENFAENTIGLNYSVLFTENCIGIVLGKVDDGVSFDGVNGNVHGDGRGFGFGRFLLTLPRRGRFG